MILPFVGSPCALADDVAGAGLGLHIDFADVFADDAQTHQLDAAHEADDADGGGPARHGAAQNSLHDGPDDADEADEADHYVLEPFLNSQGIRRIDYVFVSHADSDHINGIIGLIENDADRIGTLMLPQSQSSKKQFEQLLTVAKKEQIPIKWISKGDVFSLKTLPDLSFEVLWPSKNEKSDDTNESSLVWRLNYHDFSMLFTGDLPGDCEDELVSLKPVTVLKVAHHGSDYSTTKTFLQQITPQLAVISCSENNRYGHPGKQLLKRLEEAKIPSVLITKDCGAIIIQTDGYRVEVETYLAKQS